MGASGAPEGVGHGDGDGASYVLYGELCIDGGGVELTAYGEDQSFLHAL